MNKFLTKIATAFVGMTMAIGVGVAVGFSQEAKEVRADNDGNYTLRITRSCFSGTNSKYEWAAWSSTAPNATTAISGKAFIYTTTTGNMQFNSSKTGYHIFNTVELPGRITSIVGKRNSNGSSRTWTAYGLSSACTIGNDDKISIPSTKTNLGSSAIGTVNNGSTIATVSSGNYKFFCLEVSGGATNVDWFDIYYTVGTPSSPLDTPENLSRNESTITWDAVDNATYKVVYDGGSEISVDTNSYTIPNYVVGVHSFKVKAVPSVSGYSESPWSTTLEWDDRTVTTVSINNTKPIALTTLSDPTQLNVTTSPANLSVSYSSSSTSVATVSSSGVITPKAVGSTTITVSYAGDDTKKPSSDTVTVNVTKGVVDLPDKGTIAITGSDISGSSYSSTATEFFAEESSTPNSEFKFKVVNVLKSSSDLQFKASTGVLYSTTALSYIRSVTVSGTNSSDAVITYGTSENTGCTSNSVGTTNTHFKVENSSGNARKWQITVTYGPLVTLDGITAVQSDASKAKTYYAGEALTGADFEVTTSYSDSEEDGTITDGTGVYFNEACDQTEFELAEGNENSVTIYYKDSKERTAHTEAAVSISNDVLAGNVAVYDLEGSIGNTVRGKTYDLSGLTLKAYYDNAREHPLSDTKIEQYSLVANPTTAGNEADENNKISVEVYLNETKVHTFTNIAAPIVLPAKGSVDNPYTASEARAIALAMSSGGKSPNQYVEGIICAIDTSVTYSSSNGYKSFYITDDGTNENSYKMYHSYYGAASQKMTEEQFNSLKIGDKVLMCGTIERYTTGDSGIDMDPCFVYEHTQNTLDSHLTVTSNKTKFIIGETFNLGENIEMIASYAVAGDVEIDVTDVTYTLDGKEVTTSTVLNIEDHNGKQVVITYSDANRGTTATYSYNIAVEYAEVSSVTLTEHNVTVEPTSTHNFTAELNAGVDPLKTITWSVVNDAGSSVPLGENAIVSTGKLTATLTLNAASNISGRIIVTASCDGKSDTCTVRVTGEPYVVFNKDVINGIAESEIDNTIGLSKIEGLDGEPTGYTWTVTSGTDVVSATTGSATSTLTFIKAGAATLHVDVTDGYKHATGDIQVSVLKRLNTVEKQAQQLSKNETYDATAQGYDNGEEVALYSGTNFEVAFNKGTNNNTPKYYNSGTAVRVYGGGYFTVSSSHTLTKIELITSGNSLSTGDIGTYSSGTWTGEATSIKFTVSGTSSYAKIQSIKVYWTETDEGKTYSNVNYNAQKAVIEFAEYLTSTLNSVCDKDNGNTIFDGEDGLDAKWSDIQSVYAAKRNALSTDDRDIFDGLIKYASKSETGDSLEKALSAYDYVVKKYKTSLTEGDFLRTSDRDPVNTGRMGLIMLNNTQQHNLDIILLLIVSFLGVTAIAGYFLLKRRKEN